MKAGRLATALALLIVPSVVLSLSPDPIPRITRNTLNGVWVCYSADGSARLEINPDGTGFVVFEPPGGRAEYFKLVLDGEFDAKRGRVTFKAENAYQFENVKVWVDTAIEAIALNVENDRGSVRKFLLERESEATAQMQRFKMVVESTRASH